MPETPTICSFDGLELMILTADGKEKKLNIPTATFFQKGDQVYYLAAPHEDGIKSDPVATSIVKGATASTNENDIKEIFRYHLNYVAGVECSGIKAAVCNGEDIILRAVEKIREYEWS